MNKTGLEQEILLARTGAIITTFGELGPRNSYSGRRNRHTYGQGRQVLDPTGAGDSYSGGFLTGLVQGKRHRALREMGSVCASFAVECYGTQEYSFCLDEFNERFEACYPGER